MAELPEIGKISPEVFNQLIYPRLGAKNDQILLGPQHGVDVSIAAIGGKAVSFKTDPFSIHPEFGWERGVWFAMQILFSDSVTCGMRPTYLAVDLNLPREITQSEIETTWRIIHRECTKLGVSVIAAHTGRYPDCHYSMVGAGTVIGVGERDAYIAPAFCRPGDCIIITKGAAIQATGFFAAALPGLIESEFGGEVLKKAEDIFWQISVVEDGLTAAAVGIRDNGVTWMHDATECGINGALFELGQASGCGLQVERERIILDETVRLICGYFNIDPYSSVSEGTLVITCRPTKANEVVAALAGRNINSSVVGELTTPEKGMVIRENGQARELKHPIVDPFRKAYSMALKKYRS
jgi:hydrogenase expression/formation protein HypE